MDPKYPVYSSQVMDVNMAKIRPQFKFLSNNIMYLKIPSNVCQMHTSNFSSKQKQVVHVRVFPLLIV